MEVGKRVGDFKSKWGKWVGNGQVNEFCVKTQTVDGALSTAIRVFGGKGKGIEL
jgi:hypothetical protein